VQFLRSEKCGVKASFISGEEESFKGRLFQVKCRQRKKLNSAWADWHIM
jgi:hypothetical protein